MKVKRFFVITTLVISSFSLNAQSKGIIVKLKQNEASSFRISNGKYTTGSKAFESIFGEKLKEVRQVGDFNKTNSLYIPLNNDVEVDQKLKELKALKEVLYAEPDYEASGSSFKGQSSKTTTPNDTYFSKQWGLRNDGSMTGIGPVKVNADVDMDLAWDIETGDPNLTVAVIDSGFKMDHPELAGRIWVNSGEIPNNGIDDDGNGLIDDYQGWDFANNDNAPIDDHGHGTNCAGIILAKGNNGVGYAGANWNSKLMVLKALDANNSGTYAWMINSIYYAVDKGAKVISMSIGGSSFSQALKDAVDYAYAHNVVFVACMMNFNNEVAYYPAAFDNVIAVGSTDANDYRTAPFFWSSTSGSNFGSHIDVVAPGNYIYGLSNTSNTDYSYYWGGTSQATPLVAGIVSLILSKNNSLTVNEVRNILFQSSADLVGRPTEDTVGWDKYMGWGRVNANNALKNPILASSNIDKNQKYLTVVNPILDNIIINSNQLAGDFEIKIYAMDGKLLYQQSTKIKQGNNMISPKIEAGAYLMSVESAQYKKTFKVLKY